MNSTKTGGPAFPVGSGDMRDPTGMTLRDYFAAHTESIGADADVDYCESLAAKLGVEKPADITKEYHLQWVEFYAAADAVYRYTQADIMIRARKEI